MRYVEDRGHNSVMGKLNDGRRVYVNNGLGKESPFLVHLDLKKPRDPGRIHMGNFITSKIPEGFKGLNYDQYVFYGVWGKYMPELNLESTLQNIREWFDPGSMGWVSYITNLSKNRDRGLIVYTESSKILDGSVQKIIRKTLPDPSRFARVILVESGRPIKSIKSLIRRAGYTPIKMEPLK